MNKQEVVEKIKKIEGLNILDKIINFDSEMVSKKKVLNIVKQLDEPEKTVVPKFVAEWIDVCKENLGFGLSTAMSHSTSAMRKQPNKVKDWFKSAKNQETFAKAWLYGYEVKKQKLHTVEIPKFRFFGKVADGIKRMVMADYIDFKNELVYYHYHVYTIEDGEHTYEDSISFEDCVLMQSTGLKDKNGKEIYDGDIINYKYSSHTSTQFVVKYDKFQATFVVVDNHNALVYTFRELADYIQLNSLEVVGNIYENHELLEVK